MKEYSNKFSKRDFTQHQLAVSVCLMAYEDKVYRDVPDFLFELQEYPGFVDKVPHFTALQKFLRRISLRLLDFILQKTYEAFFQTKAANIGIDSTGERTSHASNHYIKRMKRRSKRKDYLKHSISVDTDQREIQEETEEILPKEEISQKKSGGDSELCREDQIGG